MARGRNRQNQGPRMLDRSRPFNTIMYAQTPEGRYAAFQQDGSTFDASGKLLKEGPAPEKPAAETEAPAPSKAKSYTRGVRPEDDTVDRKTQQAATGGTNDAARAAVLANFGMSDPLDEQRNALRENAAADAVEKENAE